MEAKQLLVQNLHGNLEFLKSTLKDFSDADLFVRPCPGANHVAWQLGHLCGAESFMVGAAGGKPADLPKEMGDVFKKEAATIDDPAKFGQFASKEVLLSAFGKVRQSSIAWVQSLSDADLDKPCPEKFRSWSPTFGILAAGLVTHVTMHIGQMQVARRKLGKPVLF